MENSEKSIYINGPTNAIRLEGLINNIKKIIYIFMDFHMNVTEETQCTSLYNIDFHKYIMNILPTIKHKIDLFLEITQFEIKQENADDKIYFRKKYIEEFLKYFKSEYKKKNENIRFHYIDIRDFIFYYEISNLYSKILDYSLIMWNDLIINYNMIDDSLNILNKIEEKIKNFYEMLKKKDFNEQNKTNSYFNEQNKTNIDIFFYKIKKKYNHDNVKKFINNFIDKYIIKYLDLLLNQINEYKKILEYIKRKYKSYYDLYIPDRHDLIINKYYNIKYGLSSNIIRYHIKINYFQSQIIYRMIIQIFCLTMDLYFIRRFLDKDYITNGIVYSGSYHSLTYIFILVKYFGFKITNYSYIDEKERKYSNDKLNKEIAKKKDPFELQGIFNRDEPIQCVDLGSFPKNFE